MTCVRVASGEFADRTSVTALRIIQGVKRLYLAGQQCVCYPEHLDAANP